MCPLKRLSILKELVEILVNIVGTNSTGRSEPLGRSCQRWQRQAKPSDANAKPTTANQRRTVSRHVFKKQKFQFLSFVFHFMELIVNSPLI